MSLGDPVTIEERATKTRSKVTNGRSWFVQGDGRSPWSRRWRDLVEMHARDLGGMEGLSVAQLSLIRRAATIEVELEAAEGLFSAGKGSDLTAYAAVAGHLKRILETLGLHRTPRDVTPTLSEYLRMEDLREARAKSADDAAVSEAAG
jgi:hypothetical protein